VARHEAKGYVLAWEPKDHERREIPLPKQAVDLLKELKPQAPLDSPYVFMDEVRWAYFRREIDAGTWRETRHLLNNVLRKFKTICRKAGVDEAFCIHDLRRSCITNWARKGLPIHVTQQLAGHADIKTTQEYYLSVQDDDLRAARRAQQKIVQGLAAITPSDQKLTKSGGVRMNLKRKEFSDGTQLPPDAEVA
jgi:integrase